MHRRDGVEEDGDGHVAEDELVAVDDEQPVGSAALEGVTDDVRLAVLELGRALAEEAGPEGFVRLDDHETGNVEAAALRGGPVEVDEDLVGARRAIVVGEPADDVGGFPHQGNRRETRHASAVADGNRDRDQSLPCREADAPQAQNQKSDHLGSFRGQVEYSRCLDGSNARNGRSVPAGMSPPEHPAEIGWCRRPGGANGPTSGPAGPRCPSATGDAALRKFLIMLDDTPEMLNAMRYAALRAAKTGGGVEMLAVISPEEFQHFLGVADVMRAEAHEKVEAHFQIFKDRMEKHEGITPRLAIREGDKVEPSSSTSSPTPRSPSSSSAPASTRPAPAPSSPPSPAAAWPTSASPSPSSPAP